MMAFAHPDDESHLAGSTIAKYSAEGADVVVVCATRGEAGEIAPGVDATPETLGEVRETELRASVAVAGAELELLDYRDSGMAGTLENNDPRAFAQAPESAVVDKLVTLIRKYRPQVIVTFDEKGGYGHPDHIRISKAATLAFHAAGDPDRGISEGFPPWSPDKLHYQGFPNSRIRKLIEEVSKNNPDSAFKDIDPETMGISDERITTRLDVAAYVGVRREAAAQHRSQGSPFDFFPEAIHEEVFGNDFLVRIHPKPTAKGIIESDLFATD